MRAKELFANTRQLTNGRCKLHVLGSIPNRTRGSPVTARPSLQGTRGKRIRHRPTLGTPGSAAKHGSKKGVAWPSPRRPEVGQGRDEKRPRPRSGRAKRGSGPEPWPVRVKGSDRWVPTRESETLRASALWVSAPPGLNSGDRTHASARCAADEAKMTTAPRAMMSAAIRDWKSFVLDSEWKRRDYRKEGREN